MPNREQRRHPANQHAPAPPTQDLNQLLHNQVAPPPVIINLDGCQIRIIDGATPDGPSKVILFQHVTGGAVAQAVLPANVAKEVGNMLLAPAGLVIPPPAA